MVKGAQTRGYDPKLFYFQKGKRVRNKGDIYPFSKQAGISFICVWIVNVGNVGP